MFDMPAPFSSAPSEIEAEKDLHYAHIDEMRHSLEREMFAYIKKYVLDGRRLSEVFPVAHKSVVDGISDQGWVYGHYVLEHIILHEEEFCDKEMASEAMDEFFTASASPHHGGLH